MPSNSEMYERGALDAELDELNSFYYQHYYYYRRGYDDSRRRLRREGRSPLPLLLSLALVAVALSVGFWLFGGRLLNSQAVPTPRPAALVATSRPTRPAATATPAPTATLAPAPAPVLAVGARARVVNLNGAPLRAREGPGLTQVVERIPEGSELTLVEGPAEADGLRWWRVQAGDVTGWVAEGSPEGVAFLEPIP